jgi:hypothetical protein
MTGIYVVYSRYISIIGVPDVECLSFLRKQALLKNRPVSWQHQKHPRTSSAVLHHHAVGHSGRRVHDIKSIIMMAYRDFGTGCRASQAIDELPTRSIQTINYLTGQGHAGQGPAPSPTTCTGPCRVCSRGKWVRVAELSKNSSGGMALNSLRIVAASWSVLE